MEVTIVIPVGPGHDKVARRAIASAENQSVPVRVVTAPDPDGHGAGWARNQGVRQVSTEWMLFLDADDWLENNAVERLLWQARQHPGRYVYSDWWNGHGLWATAPDTDHAWCGGTWHAISALLPTAWVRQVGGFDESLPAGEDTEFFMKLITSRRCGVRLPEPLLHYSADGQRGLLLVNNPTVKDAIWAGFRKKYGGRMSCCGQAMPPETTKTGRAEGDVLAVALWGGNQRKMGPATGRLYPRAGNGARMWVDPRDIQAAPRLWQRLEGAGEDMPEETDIVTNIEQLANRMLGGNTIRYRPDQPPETPPSGPDIARIIRMGQEALR